MGHGAVTVLLVVVLYSVIHLLHYRLHVATRPSWQNTSDVATHLLPYNIDFIYKSPARRAIQQQPVLEPDGVPTQGIPAFPR